LIFVFLQTTNVRESGRLDAIHLLPRLFGRAIGIGLIGAPSYTWRLLIRRFLMILGIQRHITPTDGLPIHHQTCRHPLPLLPFRWQSPGIGINTFRRDAAHRLDHGTRVHRVLDKLCASCHESAKVKGTSRLTLLRLWSL